MTSQPKQRLSGIDLSRGIAAYAVIQVHSGDETWGLPIEPSAIAFRVLFYFAVPFFLAASFFFSTGKASSCTSWSFWKSRIERIAIPYAVWSLLYVIVRFAFFSLKGDVSKRQALLHDPFSIAFFGGASYHLYFLPLLFAGTFLIFLIYYLEKYKIGLPGLTIVAGLSILLEMALVRSGNEFQLGRYIAFEGLANAIAPGANDNNFIRFILIQISWMVKCLPYILIAVILKQWLNRVGVARLTTLPASILFFVTFVLADLLKSYFFASSFSDLVVAYSLLLSGISISKLLGDNKFLKSLGACSFGIYLIHPIIMNLVEPFVHRIYPASASEVSILSMMAFCIPSFLFSWIAVSLLKREKRISTILFGS
jgi:peptidoglycan/LPS O-acetylase OafA/YrhL